MKKFVSLLLALVMVFSLTACGGGETNESNNPSNTGNPSNTSNPSNSSDPVSTTDPNSSIADLDRSDPPADYDVRSDAVYAEALGTFESIYSEAVKEVTDLDLRYALMAQAEAYLLESGIMMPTWTRGGNFAMSHAAARTINSTLWGVDNYRYYTAIVCNELIKSTDQNHLKSMWAELAGTGTYLAQAKAYLASQGYTFNDTYSTTYTGDPQTFDALASSRTVDSEPVTSTIDTLLVYDVEGMQQLALAESYDISADGKTYTFHLRKGVNWVDQQGRVVAPVVADDWVAGLQHVFDTNGGLGELVEGIIVNATEYADGTVTDFSQVGVKAVDEYTVEYTLEYACPYFLSMFGYSVFWPMSRTFYESKGGKFGAEFDASAADYNYGKTPADIAYNGAMLLTNYTAGNSFNWEANPTYWNKDALNVHSMKWTYESGEDPTNVYTKCKDGTFVGASLGTAVLTLSRTETPAGETQSYFDLYSYTTATDATSFMNFLNINRYRYYNFNDDAAARSSKTVADAERTAAAMSNQHFRMALDTAVDRSATRAALVGEELKYNALRNSYTPATFMSLSKSVTININGTPTTFDAGTFYGEVIQAQLDADGYPLKVWNPDLGSGDGYDGWYNPEYAVSELEKAIAELGIEITAENPIIIDYPYPPARENYTNSANACKQSIEKVLGGKVIINLIRCEDDDQWYGTGYDTTFGYEANYDMYDLSGWGPDYGDPQTYLDTFVRGGYMTKCIGIY